MRNIFCLHVGQCGLQVGFALWELLTAEHSIRRDGFINQETGDPSFSVATFFNLSTCDQYVPRGIFLDLEPTVIDQMRTGAYRQLYHPDQLINGYEDAANNFARGFHTVGRIMQRACENRIRKEFEGADRMQGIHIYRSLGGGTGSGMTATLFEILLEYPKTSKLEIPIHPSPHLSCAIVEPYNCILSEHFCMDDIDISILMDNESLYDIMIEQVEVKEPTFHNINRLVAQVCSSLTASNRFENELYNDFTILTNLVPYPRIHFPLVSYAPFGSEAKISRSKNTVSQLTHAVFDSSNQLVKCDPISGKYMSCSLVYRGEISPTEVYNTLAEIKACRFIRFVDWCPTGFKVGIVNQPPQVLPESKLGFSRKNVVMMTNSSSVSALWHRLAQKFHKLYSKRSFVHWFVAEGLEESEFCESLYNIATLAKDYEEVALDTIPTDDVELSVSPEKEGFSACTFNKQGDEGSSPKSKKKDIDVTETDEEDNNEADEGDGDGDEDGENEDNENASNVIESKHSLINLNTNQSVNWKERFEKLLKTLHNTYEQTKSSFILSESQFQFDKIEKRKFFSLKNDYSNQFHINRKVPNYYTSEMEESKFSPGFLNNDTSNIQSSDTEAFLTYDKCFLNEQNNLSIGRLNIGQNFEENLTFCSSHPSQKAHEEMLIGVNNDENSFLYELDHMEDESTTFSLMEALVRLTSSQK